jgi:hypothetical protein
MIVDFHRIAVYPPARSTKGILDIQKPVIGSGQHYEL